MYPCNSFICINLRPLFHYVVKGQPGIVWGHGSQILIFTKNALSLLCYVVYSRNSCICTTLRPSITFMGSNVNLGHLESWGQILIFAKNALSLLCYIVYSRNSCILTVSYRGRSQNCQSLHFISNYVIIK